MGTTSARTPAMERQRRRATRRSWTGSAEKSARTRSASFAARCIQWNRPVRLPFGFLETSTAVAMAGGTPKRGGKYFISVGCSGVNKAVGGCGKKRGVGGRGGGLDGVRRPAQGG